MGELLVILVNMLFTTTIEVSSVFPSITVLLPSTFKRDKIDVTIIVITINSDKVIIGLKVFFSFLLVIYPPILLLSLIFY